MGKKLKDNKIWLTATVLIAVIAFASFTIFQNPSEKFEKQSIKKIKNMLETVVGEGNARVEVSAIFNSDNSKIISENFRDLKDGFSTEIKNTSSKGASLKRLSVGVVVNKTLSQGEKEEIEKLIGATIGLDPQRGDVLTISSFKFNSVEEIQGFNPIFIPFILVFLFGGVIMAYLFKKPEEAQEMHITELPELDFSNIADEDEEEIPMSKNLNAKLKNTVAYNPQEAAKLLSLFIKERI